MWGTTFFSCSTRAQLQAEAESESQKAQYLARFAAQILVSDLRREMQAGSLPIPGDKPVPLPGTLLHPATPWSVPPQISTQTEPELTAPNLIKQSAYGKRFFDAERTVDGIHVYPSSSIYAPSDRASSWSTESAGSKGNITHQRWNAPGLLPENQPDPAGPPNGLQPAFPWRPPEWIFIDSKGQTPVFDDASRTKNDGHEILCRFAYQIYDTGGLLNLQVAGFTPNQITGNAKFAARRGSPGFCDLEQIGFTPEAIRILNTYRYPDPDLSMPAPNGYGHPFADFLLLPRFNHGFLRCSVKGSGVGISNRAFSGRKALLRFLKVLEEESRSPGLARKVSQFVAHHGLSVEQPGFRMGWFDGTRKGERFWGQSPTVIPPAGLQEDCLHGMETVSLKLLPENHFRRQMGPHEMPLGNNRGGNDAWGTLAQRTRTGGDHRRLQDIINPTFPEVRLPRDGSVSFTRLDGSPAVPGEPLVKTRFPLRRLAWLTHKGPAAGLESSDPLYDPEATPDAIYRAFGLRWIADPGSGAFLWGYDHGRRGGIYRLEELLETDAASGRPREPDFFELLKAAIGVGSLGKSALLSHRVGECWDPPTYAQARDRNSVFQIFEIGANLVDQWDADSFPTRIRLSHPGVRPGSNPFFPSFFTANGIEDLPYLYRFHWRPIRSGLHPMRAPSDKLEVPSEITDEIAQYRGEGFECGTTSILGFPELWNPHQQLTTSGSAGVATGGAGGAFPRQLRVVAANETPVDELDPLLGEGVRAASLPQLDAQSRKWINLLHNGEECFVIRPYGFFAYHSESAAQTLTWMDSLPLRCDVPARYNTATQSHDWPSENIPSSSLSSPSARSTSLFWNRAPILPSSVAHPFPGQRLPQLYLGIWPVWKLGSPSENPTGAGTSPEPTPQTLLPWEQPPAGWPVSSGYRGSPVLRLRGNLLKFPSLVDFPLAGKAQKTLFYHALNTNKTYRWTGKAYAEMRYPLAPDAASSFSCNGFCEQAGNLRFANGTRVPFPLPATQKYLFALTDQPGKQRVLFESNPAMKIPPGSPPWNSGNTPQNRIIDLRGSELVFQVGHPGLFREPTTLCQRHLPSGSLLECGRDNFLSGPPHDGSFVDAEGKRWVGFSMGEIPSSFIALTKLYRRDRVASYQNGKDDSEGFSWNIDNRDPAEDVAADRWGRTSEAAAQGKRQTVRAFRIPVNVAGVNRTHLCVRLQYRDASTDRWVTYQERFFSIEGLYSGRGSAAPVGTPEYRLDTPAHPQDTGGSVPWTDNHRILSWGAPFVTSYDPRCVRFGNPMRPGYNGAQTVHGLNARERPLLGPTAQNPHAVFPEGGAPTDQPGAALVDLPQETIPAKTVTGVWPVPGGWFHWFNEGYNYGSNYREAYRYASGTLMHPVWRPLWWASAAEASQLVLKAPTADAGDFGWHPRARSPSPPGSTRTFKGASPDPSLPNFFQNPLGTNHADTLRPGAFAENCAPNPRSPYAQAYADPDDVIRRASGGLARTGESPQFPHGFPLAQTDPKADRAARNRPIVLNRPFHSVAEMGYAFRGAPWKELDFANPESADAALLDVFTVSGEGYQPGCSQPLVAGKIHLNTRQEPVLRALLSGAIKDESAGNGSGGSGFSAQEAAAIARLLIERTTSTKPWHGPLCNPSELVGRLVGKNRSDCKSTAEVYTSRTFRSPGEPQRNPDFPEGDPQLEWHFSGFSHDLARLAESDPSYRNPRALSGAIRALADPGQTRVWNLLIDMIVQTAPRFHSQGSPLDWEPTAQERVWVHLSMDRFTGEILDMQWEQVDE